MTADERDRLGRIAWDAFSDARWYAHTSWDLLTASTRDHWCRIAAAVIGAVPMPAVDAEPATTSRLEEQLIERAAHFKIGAGGHPDSSFEYAWLPCHPGLILDEAGRELILITPKLLREAAGEIGRLREQLADALAEIRRLNTPTAPSPATEDGP